ncbi:hypothetical protein RF55_18340, partial [Lasius niger]
EIPEYLQDYVKAMPIFVTVDTLAEELGYLVQEHPILLMLDGQALEIYSSIT